MWAWLFVLLAGGLLVRLLAGRNSPAVGDRFICKSCGKTERHTTWTVDQYRRYKHRQFYCYSCNREHGHRNIMGLRLKGNHWEWVIALVVIGAVISRLLS